jgi:hypothetical protein
LPRGLRRGRRNSSQRWRAHGGSREGPITYGQFLTVVTNAKTGLEFGLRQQHAGLSHPEAIACADQWVHATAKKASPCFLVWPHIS